MKKDVYKFWNTLDLPRQSELLEIISENILLSYEESKAIKMISKRLMSQHCENFPKPKTLEGTEPQIILAYLEQCPDMSLRDALYVIRYWKAEQKVGPVARYREDRFKKIFEETESIFEGVGVSLDFKDE